MTRVSDTRQSKETLLATSIDPNVNVLIYPNVLIDPNVLIGPNFKDAYRPKSAH